jgi:hypothetical protein|tara:strand:- start:1425 stop:1631 length:207 start_codon:yes stop_codon:yes gene_type:complete
VAHLLIFGHVDVPRTQVIEFTGNPSSDDPSSDDPVAQSIGRSTSGGFLLAISGYSRFYSVGRYPHSSF